MKKLLALCTSRQVMIPLLSILFLMLVWFVGPLLSLGGLHPFSSIGMRISTIAMVLALLLFFLQSWPLGILGITTAAILIWHAGPAIALGAFQPLDSVVSRLLAIVSLIASYAIVGLSPIWHRLRLSQHPIGRWLSRKGGSTHLANDELRIVHGIIERAISQLKHMHAPTTGIKRFFEGRRYMYELPWYMIIGSPGAGKTTALINSGMKFPLAEQMKASAETLAHAGQGGTAHCDWWLTNDAVLIDTAGRYASQEMDHQRDNAEWLGFLHLLRRQRSRSPINGAIVTISLAELLTQDKHARALHAVKLRDRLSELRQHLGIQFPVYVMITKMDLLEGFREYFQQMCSEELAQVWGVTFPYTQGTPDKKEQPLQRPPSIASLVQKEIQQLATRLEEGLLLRLREEPDPQRRKKLYVLPQEFTGIITAISEMVEQVFQPSRFDDMSLYHCLRGIYFTSAAQAKTSISANTKSLLQRFRESLSGSVAPFHDPSTTLPHFKRSYFLHDLLAKNMIADAGLVRPNLKWEWRFRVLRIMGNITALFACIWLSAMFLVSYDNNQEYLHIIDDKTRKMRPILNGMTASARGTSGQDYLNVLNVIHTLPYYRHLDTANPPAAFTYGLYSIPPVVTASQELYTRAQENFLVPILAKHMENVLQQAISSQDAAAIHRTLRIYLQLHTPNKYQSKDLLEWMTQNRQSGNIRSDFSTQPAAMEHLVQLVSSGRIIQSPFIANSGLIQRARAFLDAHPSTTYLYQQVRKELDRETPDGFSATTLVGPAAFELFSRTSGKSLEDGVPGAFTYAGYHDHFDRHLPELLATAQKEEDWIMGRQRPEKEHIPDNPLLLLDMRKQYLQEYKTAWTSYLQDTHLQPGNSIEDNLALLKTLAGSQSPLMKFIRAAAHETTLTVELPTGDDDGFFSHMRMHFQKHFGQEQTYNKEDQLVHDIVEVPFAGLRDTVTAASETNGIPSLKTVQGMLADLRSQLSRSRASLRGGMLPEDNQKTVIALRQAAGSSPLPMQHFLTDILQMHQHNLDNASASVVMPQTQAAFDQIRMALQDTITSRCQDTIHQKYPFSAQGADALPDDVVVLFAPNGAIATFFRQHLATYVNTTGKPWKWKEPAALTPTDSHTATMQREVLKMLQASGLQLKDFELAQQITKTLFQDGSDKITLRMHLQITDMSPQIQELSINIDGQAQHYAHGPVQRQPLTWPGPLGGSVVALQATPDTNGASLMTRGPWALWRLLDKARIRQISDGHIEAIVPMGARKVILDWQSAMPLTPAVFQSFSCPRMTR